MMYAPLSMPCMIYAPLSMPWVGGLEEGLLFNHFFLPFFVHTHVYVSYHVYSQ